MTPWAHFKSASSLLVITLNLLVWSILLVVLGLLKLVAPPFRPAADRSMDAMYRAAVAIDDAWLRGVLGIRWSRSAHGLDRNRTYVVVSNHASWTDILLLQSVLVRDGPLLKFLTKRSLVWIPIFGVIFWAFDFPLLRRHRGEQDSAERRRGDLEALRSACRVVRERPAALINFAEGTRFSPEKRVASGSPYQHLLRPRVGGLATLLDALEGDVYAVLDVTLVYTGPISLWAFLSGAITDIEIDVARIPRGEIPHSRAGQSAWLADRWLRKDQRIDRARHAR